MEGLGIILIVLGSLIPMFIFGGIVYLIVRRRNGNGGITAYEALITYFYSVIAVSVITMVVGLGFLVYALFTQLYNDKKLSDSITIGTTLAIVGLIICLLHIVGRRSMEKPEIKATRTLKRIFLFFMLSIFSLSGLVALPSAAYYTVKYYVEDTPKPETPEASLAIALIILPFWVYYLFRVLKEMRAEKPEPQTGPSTIN